MIGPETLETADATTTARGIEAATRTFEASVESSAAPEVVFPLLTDLSAHLEWGGRAYQGRGEYLTALDGPPGSAVVGATWTSRGHAHEGAYEDRSVVTAVEAPHRFEFRTAAAFRRGTAVTRYELRHSYTVSAIPGGSRIRHRVEHIGRPEGGSRISRLLLSSALAPIVDRMGRGLLRTGLGHLAAMAEAQQDG